jgi:hypothetical protein
MGEEEAGRCCTPGEGEKGTNTESKCDAKC